MIGLESRKVLLDILMNSSEMIKKKVLENTLLSYNFSAQDHGFIFELMQGITKREKTLSWIIDYFSAKPPKSKLIRTILYIGLYQLFFTNIPPYAILNTSVELAKHKKLNHAAKYINGLLRNVQRSIKFIQEKQHHSTILPCELGAWQFSSPLFPSPDTKFSQYLSIVYSYPEYLVETWQQEFGENMCEQLLQNGNCIAPVYLRDRNSSLPDILHNLNIKYIKYNNLFQLDTASDIQKLPKFEQGKWAVTGIASTKVIEALELTPNISVLDVCAAPGGKTLQIIDKIQGQGKVIAMDISKNRLESLQFLKQTYPPETFDIKIHDGTKSIPEWNQTFDRVLVDAPCSNSGVFSKRTEARWRFSPQNLTSLGNIQSALLHAMAPTVKIGGILLYSTCSIEKKENDKQIQTFLQNNSNFQFEEKQIQLPLAPSFDGGSYCKLRRISE